MYYKTEFNLYDFPAWSGGHDTLETLKEKNLVDDVQAAIEEIYCEESPTDTEINDFLWFERDTIAEWLGFSSWDDLEYGEDEEEEEEEENEEEENAFTAFCDSFAACENCPYRTLPTVDRCRQAFKADHEE